MKSRSLFRSQGTHWVDCGSAVCWEQASGGSYSDKNAYPAGNDRGIGRAHLKQQAPHDTGEACCDPNSSSCSNEDRHHSIAQHEGVDICGLSAKSQADTDLLLTLDNGVRDDTVDA